MEKKFTKSQRHKYYKAALKIVRSHITACICKMLDYCSKFECKDYEITWPEFAEQKPENREWSEGWFPPTKAGQAKRIAILKKCISKTRPITIKNK